MKIFAPLPVGRQPSAPATLEEYVVALGRAASSIAIEAIGGRRGHYQLDRIAMPEVVEKVKLRAQLVREAVKNRPDLRTSGMSPFHLGKAILKSPQPGVYEVVICCHEPGRVRVCAARIVPFRDRYKVSHLEIG